MEIRPVLISNKTDIIDVAQSNHETKPPTCHTEVFSERFARFSKWDRLIRAVARLKFMIRQSQLT